MNDIQRPILALALVAACGSSPAPAGKEYFGTAVAPPAAFLGIRRGMPLVELKQRVPGIKESPARGFRVPSKAPNIELYVIAFPSDAPDAAVSRIYASVDGLHVQEMLTAAWGPADAAGDPEYPDRVVWRSATTGWRASLECRPRAADGPYCDVWFDPYQPLEALITGKAVTPPDPLSKLRVGMPIAEASEVAGFSLAKLAGCELPYEGVSCFALTSGDRFLYLQLEAPARARDLIMAQWGPGTPSPEDTLELTWMDPATGWRATVTPGHETGRVELAFVNYLPFIKLFDLLLDPARPMLGLPVAEAQKTHPELCRVPGVEACQLPLTDLTEPGMELLGTTVSLFQADGRVNELHLMFRFNDMFPGGREAILAALEAKWGTPKRDKGDGSYEIPLRHYGDHVSVYEQADLLSISVE